MDSEWTGLAELNTSQSQVIVHVQVNDCAVVEREAVCAVDHDACVPHARLHTQSAHTHCTQSKQFKVYISRANQWPEYRPHGQMVKRSFATERKKCRITKYLQQNVHQVKQHYTGNAS